MSENNTGALRRIVWTEVFPWLLLARVFRIAIQVRQVLLGMMGFFLMFTGWWLVTAALAPAKSSDLAEALPSTATAAESPPVVAAPPLAHVTVRASLPDRAARYWSDTLAPWSIGQWPVERLLAGPDAGWRGMLQSLLCAAWAILVWSFFGGAICRSASLQLATRQSDHIGSTVRFARRKWRSFAAAPVIPLVGILVAALPVVIFGVLLRWDWSSMLTALIWPLLLAFGVVMAVLGLVLAFAWPLMWANVATEGSDCFEAVARSYDYTFHRPLHYAFYAAVASILGALGWLVVSMLLLGVLEATSRAAGWGCGREAIDALRFHASELEGPAALSAWLIGFWQSTLALLGTGYLFSYFWSSASAIYLLLRQAKDATELDECLAEDEDQTAVALPPLKTDAQGAPEVDTAAG